MASNNKRLLWIVALLISHLLFFFIGSATGRYLTFHSFARQTEKAEAQENIGRYIVYRDLAGDMKAGRHKNAKCSADLLASSFFDDARRCAANSECWGSLPQDQVQRMPEVTGSIPLPFDYIEAKNGIRRCPGERGR